MTVEELKNNICKDLIVGAFERQDRKFLVTRFTYPVGDSVNLYLVDDNGQLKISDLGTTHYFLRVANVDIDTVARMDFVKSICAGFDIEIGLDFSLSKSISKNTVGEDVLAFCQAITRISALHYDQRAKQFQTFAHEIDVLIAKSLPIANVVRGWTDQAIDPEGNYPIDYRFYSPASPRNLFVVKSRLSAETTIGTMNFYLAKSRLDKSMTVVAPDLNLPRRVEKKLEMTSRVIFGANESQILRFATNESLN